MKKWLSFLLVLSVLLSGCGGQSAAQVSENAVTFTDDLGRTVTVENPRRVAALLGSFAQVWQLAGGQVCASADDAWEDLALDMPEDAVNLGGTKHLSLELLLSARPDFILASTNTRQNLQWQETLEGTGIAVAYFDIDDFEDYLRLLQICTRITGRQDLYETHGTAVQQRLEAAVEKGKERVAREGAPKILCVTASASSVYVKNSQGNVLGAMLKTLGCENIADSETSLLENVSMEHILLSDPEYIFFAQRGDDEAGMRDCVRRLLMEDPAWGSLTAVKNGNVYFMEKALFSLKPNHRWAEAYEILEGILSDG